MKMGLNIISEYDNKLLERKDVVAEVDFSGPTPTKSDIAKMIGSKFGAEEKLVAVRSINNQYGEQKAKVNAFVYNSLDQLKKFEEYKEEEKKEEAAPEGEQKPEQAPVAEEKPAEEKKEEAPAEKPKEEKKEEPKPEEKAEEKPAEKKEGEQ